MLCAAPSSEIPAQVSARRYRRMLRCHAIVAFAIETDINGRVVLTRPVVLDPFGASGPYARMVRWWRSVMKCLRIYATPDGESHFGDADIAMTTAPLFPNEAPFQLSPYFQASRVRFVRIPGGVREAGFHTPPAKLLAIWLNGHVEFETSDGETRRVAAGNAVLVEDTHGKGHISRHPPDGQNLIIVLLPAGLDLPIEQ